MSNDEELYDLLRSGEAHVADQDGNTYEADDPRMRKFIEERFSRPFTSGSAAGGSIPSHLNYIKSAEDESTQYLAGPAHRIDEMVKERGDRVKKWNFDISLDLSPRGRVRTYTGTLWTPQSAPVDFSAFLNASSLREHGQERRKQQSRHVCLIQGILSEENRKEEGLPPIPSANLDSHNLTPQGFLRRVLGTLEEAADPKFGKPDGGTLIRLVFDQAYVIAFSLSELRRPEFLNLATRGVEDWVRLRTGDGRYKHYMPDLHKYVFKGEKFFQKLAAAVDIAPKYNNRVSFVDTR